MSELKVFAKLHDDGYFTLSVRDDGLNYAGWNKEVYAKDYVDAVVSRLNAKISELEKDAMRYQWLRDESYKEPYAPGPAYRSLYDGIGGSALNTDLCRVWLKYGTALDDAIDSQLNVPGNK